MTEHGQNPEVFDVKHVQKEWGYELWYANNKEEGYCAKFLNIKQGHKFSMHFHADKHETFTLIHGEAKLFWVDTRNGFECSVPMEEGKSYEIPRFMPHRVEALADSTVLEVSTYHRDEDSHRCYK